MPLKPLVRLLSLSLAYVAMDAEWDSCGVVEEVEREERKGGGVVGL